MGCSIGTDWIDSSNRGNDIGIDDHGFETIIGDSTLDKRNIISNNSSDGILAAGTSSLIQGNYIGTNRAGTTALSNGTGISKSPSGSNNQIQDNLISGNIYAGITLVMGCEIQGNIIGLSYDQNTAIPNGIGIDISAQDCYVGASTGNRNIIAGNISHDIKISNVRNSIIQNNYIGVSDYSTVFSSNTCIALSDAGNCLIGGISPGDKNFICGNGIGIDIQTTVSTTGNTIIGNCFGILPNGQVAPSTFTDAIHIYAGATNNLVGLKSNIGSNLIAGGINGITINGAATTNNSILGNTICAFSNKGIALTDNANQNKSAPIITYASVTQVAGTSGQSDYIEVFLANGNVDKSGGSLQYLGSTTAINGQWSMTPVGAIERKHVCATATDVNNTSEFSKNAYIHNVFINLINPSSSIPNTTISLSIKGDNFTNPAGVKLIRNGFSDIVASQVIVKNESEISCEFNFNNQTPGYYTMQINTSSTSGELNKGFLIQEQLPDYLQWNITDIGYAGTPASGAQWRGTYIADCDNDGLNEVMSSGLLHYLVKFDYNTTDWTVSTLPFANLGENYTDVIIGDANHDGYADVYGSRIDNKVLMFSGSPWAENNFNGQGIINDEVYEVAYGDGNNDSQMEIYTACKDGHLYELKYDFLQTATWSKTDIGSVEGTAEFHALALGDGNNDDFYEVYGASTNGKIYQFKYNGSTWDRTLVGFGDDVMSEIVVADGDNDGQFSIYAVNQDDKIYSFHWTNNIFFAKAEIAQIASNDIAIGDPDNNGLNELYCATKSGHIFQLSNNSGNWLTTDLGLSPSPLQSLAIGDGDNNNMLELYATGNNSHVYQFKAMSLSTPTPTPTSTATPLHGFNGRIIAKKYTYTAPNPVRGPYANFVVHVQEACEIVVKVYTTSNQFVMSFNLNCASPGKYQKQVHMANLANGVYLFLVKAKINGTEKERLIKKIAYIK